MATFVERLMAKAAGQNKLNKALYSNWYNTGMPVSPGRNYTSDLIEGYLDNATIYSIVNRIARPASEIPMQIVDGNDEVIEGHWSEKIIQQPNEDNTLSELIFAYYVYLLSIGNSFIYAPKLKDGRATELWTMPGEITECVAGTWREPVKGYTVIYGSEMEEIAKADVMHSKLFYPRFNTAGSWLYGLSPIQVAAEAIRGLNAADKRQALLAERGGPPFIISSQMPEGLTEAQQEMLEDTYSRKYSGVENTNHPMMTGTPVKVERVGTNSADLELIKSSEYATRVLCNVYGIDSVLLNDKSASTYNNIVELRKDLYTATIIPLNNIFENKLKAFLTPLEDVYYKFDYSKVEVLSSTVDARMIALNEIAFLDDNEKREMFGYEPREEQPKPIEDE